MEDKHTYDTHPYRHTFNQSSSTHIEYPVSAECWAHSLLLLVRFLMEEGVECCCWHQIIDEFVLVAKKETMGLKVFKRIDLRGWLKGPQKPSIL